MKRFVRNLGLFAAIQAAIGAAIFSSIRPDDDHYAAATIDKNRLLDEAPPPRVIFVGGSSVAFSTDCPTVERRMPPYHAVNMGLMALLGVEYMLGEVAGRVRQGDIVIISLEYEQFVQDQSSAMIVRVLEHRPANLAYFSPKRLGDLGMGYIGAAVRRGLRGIRGKRDRSEPPYVRSGFNECGDLVMHRTMPPPEFAPPTPLRLLPGSQGQIDRTIDRLNAFGRLSRRGGASAFYAHPAVMQSYYDRSRQAVEHIDAELRRRLGFPVLNTPRSACLPRQMFFNSNYHPGEQGALKRTNDLVDALRAKLGPAAMP